MHAALLPALRKRELLQRLALVLRCARPMPAACAAHSLLLPSCS